MYACMYVGNIYVIDFSRCIFLANVTTLTLADDSDLKQSLLKKFSTFSINKTSAAGKKPLSINVSSNQRL